MVVNNIKELLLKSLNKSGKQDQVTKSIIWKHIIETYKEKKGIDITPYIISVQLKNTVCIVQTQKPILNTDMMLYEHIFQAKILTSFKDIGIKINTIEFRYK